MTDTSPSPKHPGNPGWWILLAISLALVATLFAKSSKSEDRSAPNSFARQPYSDQYRAGSSIEWTIGAANTTLWQSDLPVSSSDLGLQQSEAIDSTRTTGVSYSFPGYLSYPDNVISSFPIGESAGTVVARASWSPAAPLELSVTCGPANQTANGSFDASVIVITSTSSCTVALEEQGAVVGSIDYTVDVTVSPAVRGVSK